MKIIPSVLDVELNKSIISLLDGRFDRIHIDVMDGTFTKTKSKYNPKNVKRIKTDLIKDVHLMVNNPEKYIIPFKKAGAKIINFHIEVGNTDEIISLIKNNGMRVSLVLNPGTPISKIRPYLHKIDEVLVMGVHPGKCGQAFIGSTSRKISRIRKLREDIIIKVDGGINNYTLNKVKGCDYVVSGSYLFKDPNVLKSLAFLDKEAMARRLRESVLKMLIAAKSGHPAGSLGMADVFVELFCDMKYDPLNPSWKGRDYLVLSNGHICPILYSAMANFGFFSLKELLTLRKFGSRLQGHPHRESLPGLETTSGPLGSGLSEAAGMALGLKIENNSNKVFCVVSDGEQDEGNLWEGVMFASKYHLDNLVCIMDYNGIQLSGTTKEVMPLGNLRKKYKSFGWNVKVINGHNFSQIRRALNYKTKRPLMIIAKTISGKGVYFMERKWEWHGKAPTENALRVFENE